MAEGGDLVSTPKYIRVTRVKYRIIMTAMIAVGMLVGIALSIFVNSVIMDDQVQARTVCPEHIGHIAEDGELLFITTTCDNYFVAFATDGGRYNLTFVADEVLNIMGTGKAEVGGDRIYFDMGDLPDIDKWLEALNQATLY